MTKEIKLLSKKLKKRNDSSSKSEFGTVSIICGSDKYRGCASLAVSAALRCGVGVTRLCSTEKVISSVASKIDECTYLPINEGENGAMCDEDFINKQKLIKNSDAVLVGCGMTDCVSTNKIVSSILSRLSCPCVIDADALNSIKNCPERLLYAKRRPIITPHIGEMSRLTGLGVEEIKAERVKVALDFSKKYNCITVLKDSVTAVTDPEGEVFLNTVENSGLAKGGSGDVLAGIIVSLLGQGMSSYDSACMGVLIHSLAGEICSEQIGKEAMLPSDVINSISAVFKLVKKEIEK